LTDKKYQGKKTSRKELYGDSSSEEEEDEDEDEEINVLYKIRKFLFKLILN